MKVAVFGLGYVGAVTSACLAADGHEVWGVDVDPVKVGSIAAGRSPIAEPGLSDLVAAGVASGRLRVTADATEAVAGADVSLLCVGTPSTAEGRTDLTYVHRVVVDLADALAATSGPGRPVHAVAVRSTVPPGTVEGIGARLRELVPSVATGVAMCPEFLREGTSISDFHHPPYTIIGSTDQPVVDALSRLFGPIDAPIRVVDTRTAEALKYACNAFHATKISFANELGRLFRVLDVDSRQVMDLFCEDRHLNISPRYLRPGFAFGGSCLPKDLRSLLHMARMESIDLPLLAGTLATNRLEVAEVVERITYGHGRRAALLGLSFKKDSDDLRESPYVDLAEALIGKGYEVRIYDPLVHPAKLIGANRQYVESRLPHLGRLLTERAADALDGADVAVVAFQSADVVTALLESRPRRIIDLDGRLGAAVEGLPGYEGSSW